MKPFLNNPLAEEYLKSVLENSFYRITVKVFFLAEGPLHFKHLYITYLCESAIFTGPDKPVCSEEELKFFGWEDHLPETIFKDENNSEWFTEEEAKAKCQEILCDVIAIGLSNGRSRFFGR